MPELNLNEVSESESDADDEEVLPLDFRTAMLEKDSRVVIQVKPLVFKQFGEDDEEGNSKHKHMGTDSYLERARKEAFKEEEGAIMIDPDINIKDKFQQIDLPCNKERRINNSFNAPIRHNIPSKQEAPASTKTYESDAGASEVEENQIDSRRGSVPVEKISLKKAEVAKNDDHKK